MRGHLAAARRWIDLALGRACPTDAAQLRTARILQGAATGLGNRAIGIAVGLVSVPLAVGYLGKERYGAWVTISSIVAWLAMADLGMGNGLTNAIAQAEATGRPQLARRHVASAFCLLSGMSALIAALLFGAWPFLDWAAIFNVQSHSAQQEVGTAIGLAVALFALSFPLSLLEKVYLAYQEGAIANGWSAVGNLASLAAIVVAIRTHGGMIALVAAYSGTALVVSALNALWLFWRHRPYLRPSWAAVDRDSASQLLGTGGRFFVVQLAGIVLFNTDNIIIAHMLGAAQVTPYSVAFRLFAIVPTAVGLYLPYLWTAYADAFARGDGPWIARTFRSSIGFSAAAAALLTLPLLLFGTEIIRVWAGAAAVPSTALLAWMAAWNVIIAPANTLAIALNGAGQLRGQMVYGLLAAVANIALSIVLARTHGSTGVMAATVISYLAFAAVPVSLEGLQLVRRTCNPTECEPS